MASVPAQQGFHPQEGKEQLTPADECRAMHRSDSSAKPYPGRPGCLAIINSWLNSPAGSTGDAVPAATDSDSQKVHWRKSIHGKNESEGHSTGIWLFTEKRRGSNQSQSNPNREQH